ncbi:OmpA family protein [Rubrivirga sp.]|uniref:OmpA family protein n=1 Tax=Rubrivirga sp. TaxID=1885344 RepID=UPI003C77E978
MLALGLVVAASAMAQPVYNGLDDPFYDNARDNDEWPGVRLGLGVGASVYDGPDLLVGQAAFQDDIVATNLGVTAEVTFPLSAPLYGRLQGGLLNIGADSNRPDLDFASDNPFLTSEVILAEANLLYYFNNPRRGLAPYVFTGLSGLFATGDASPGVETTALAIPVGLGLEYGISDNVSLYGEASYRFGITEVGTERFAAAFGPDPNGYCKEDGPNYDPHECEKLGEEPNPEPPVDGGNSSFDTRFNSALIGGGLRLGFGGGGRAPIPPPVVLPPVVVPPPVAPPPPPAPLVCDLVELNSVYFDYGTGSLDRRARALLDENVELLLDNSACCVFIDGYTDTAEGDSFGMGLAGRRAQAVYDYYLSRGVNSTRLQVRNRGTAVPTCDKEDPGPGCERNRRVESLPVDCERFEFLLENPSYDPY